MTDGRAEGPRSKRSAILDAAVDSFGQYGYEHTKWAAIADQVGIGQTALYHYFESKAHCLLTVMSIELSRSADRFHRAIEGNEKMAEAVFAAADGAFDVTPREVRALRVLYSHLDLLETPRRSGREEAQRMDARQHLRGLEESWIMVVQRGMAAGEFPQRDATQAARALMALVSGVWRWYRPDGDPSVDEIRAFVAEACVRLVAH